MKFKSYPQETEKQFTRERTLKKCNFTEVSTDIDMPNNEYRDLMRETILGFHEQMFDYLCHLFLLLIQKFDLLIYLLLNYFLIYK